MFSTRRWYWCPQCTWQKQVQRILVSSVYLVQACSHEAGVLSVPGGGMLTWCWSPLCTQWKHVHMLLVSSMHLVNDVQNYFSVESLKSLLFVFPLFVVVYNRSKDSGFNLDTRMDSLVLLTFTGTNVKEFNLYSVYYGERDADARRTRQRTKSETRIPLVWRIALKRLPLGSRKRHGYEQDKSVPGTEEKLGPACVSAEGWGPSKYLGSDDPLSLQRKGAIGSVSPAVLWSPDRFLCLRSRYTADSNLGLWAEIIPFFPKLCLYTAAPETELEHSEVVGTGTTGKWRLVRQKGDKLLFSEEPGRGVQHYTVWEHIDFSRQTILASNLGQNQFSSPKLNFVILKKGKY